MGFASIARPPVLALALICGFAAQAQDFPVKGKPIILIVPYAPGGVTDTAGRLMADALSREFQTPVQVVNKVGAASQVGLSELIRAPADGYTLSYAVLPTVTTHYLDPGRQAPYARKDFQPIAIHHTVSQVLAVKSDSPWKTIKELIEAAREQPGRINVSDSGLMGVPHLNTLMLSDVAGVKFSSVHFGGGAPSITALLGGHVQVLAGATADALPNKQSGAFRVLAVSAEQPDKSMPEVPTMRSQGYDVLAASWTGILAPAGTPPHVVDILAKTMKKIIESPEHVKRLDDLTLSAVYRDPDEYAKIWIDNETRLKPLLEKLAKEPK